MLLVPLFDVIIYPFFARFNLLKKQLQRMGVGLVFAIFSFILAAVLELQMQNTSAALNRPNQIRVLNLSPCDLNLVDINKQEMRMDLEKYQPLNLDKSYLDSMFKDSNQTKFNLKAKCASFNHSRSFQIVVNDHNLPKTIVFYLSSSENTIKAFDYAYNLKDQLVGSSQIKLSTFGIIDSNLTLHIDKIKPTISNEYTFDFKDLDNSTNYSNSSINDLTSYIKVDYSDYRVQLIKNNNQSISSLQWEKKIALETCARYTILLVSKTSPSKTSESDIQIVVLTDVYANGIHVGWQLIQIFVMAIGEIMFSISGLTFAYSQAPEAMKSVLQAVWFLTIALGNFFVFFVAEVKLISNQVHEYFFFAGLLVLATLIFMILGYFYKYVEENDRSKIYDSNVKNVDESGAKTLTDLQPCFSIRTPF